MATEPEQPPITSIISGESLTDSPITKNQAKKKKKKDSKKEAQKTERTPAAATTAAATTAAASATPPPADSDDPFAGNYGHTPAAGAQSKGWSSKKWTDVSSLSPGMAVRTVLIRGWAQAIRSVGKKMVFVVVRQGMSSVQCVLAVSKHSDSDSGRVSQRMVQFVSGLSKESVIDVEGLISVPSAPITSTTQQVEIQVRKLYCITLSVPNLPINIEDASRSETELEKAELAGEQLVRVGQDTRLNHRVLDLRTPANQSIFRLQCEIETKFRNFLLSRGFVGIHTPKLIAGSSEGGAAVFKLEYSKGQPACLAQSPQLHKQMAICGGFERVFEVGPVFRAEDSFTHRHLCEFVGLDAEMRIMEHYFEVCDIVDGLFVEMFEHLNNNCKRELETITKQYPFEPLKYLPKTLRLTYDEGVQMLKEAGTEIEPMGDLNTDAEKKLGRLIRQKYNTDFYMLYRYPLAVRPFYTMPCYDDPAYSNSFDVFIRGEEIISGAQRVHIPELLTNRVEALGIDVSTISTYIDAFRYGAPPHGGFGVGLERVVMLFCGLNNIRKTSLFPRDPHRLVP